ncbi:MAG: hypothetical protein FJZ67_02455 [Bacteroidetes bacterium]|nr:hypothetical protein [Bacteroidota bacterium]
MIKTEATLLNAIPTDIHLTDYFDSLTLFEKRELIQELEFCKELQFKTVRRNFNLVLFSHVVSLVCYLGVQQEWFFYCLLCIHVPMDILLFLKINSNRTYQLAIEFLEKRMAS